MKSENEEPLKTNLSITLDAVYSSIASERRGLNQIVCLLGDDGRISVPSPRAMNQRGYFEKGLMFLRDIECLFQVERNTARVEYRGVVLSLQEVYEKFARRNKETRLIYGYLMRQGYSIKMNDREKYVEEKDLAVANVMTCVGVNGFRINKWHLRACKTYRDVLIVADIFKMMALVKQIPNESMQGDFSTTYVSLENEKVKGRVTVVNGMDKVGRLKNGIYGIAHCDCVFLRVLDGPADITAMH